MSPNPTVSLTMREWDRLKVIEAVVQTGWKPGRALTTTELSILAARTDNEVANALRSNEHAPGSRREELRACLKSLSGEHGH